jgi:hypothetical protein
MPSQSAARRLRDKKTYCSPRATNVETKPVGARYIYEEIDIHVVTDEISSLTQRVYDTHENANDLHIDSIEDFYMDII